MTGDSGLPRFAPFYFDITTGEKLSPQDAFEPVTRLFVWTAQDDRLWQISSAENTPVRVLGAEPGTDAI